MRAFILGLVFLGLTSLCFAQEEGKLLSEVEVYATNYDYLKSVKSNSIHPAISLLECKVAKFDVKSLNLEEDRYLTYTVLFFIPKGKISALYDNDNNIIRTIEKFSDVNLPIPVVKSVLKTYPDYDYLHRLAGRLVNHNNNFHVPTDKKAQETGTLFAGRLPIGGRADIDTGTI